MPCKVFHYVKYDIAPGLAKGSDGQYVGRIESLDQDTTIPRQ
jgi:hypothetical protein